MRLLFALLAFLATTAAASPLFQFKLDSEHSSANAKVAFMGLANASAQFPQMSGEMKFWPDRPDAFEFHVVADARAITASNGIMRRTLKGPNFFDAERHPWVTFTGNAIQLTSATTGTVTGDLTARGVTRPITLTVKFASPPLLNNGSEPIDFTAATQINRREFGMTAYPLVVGNTVKIAITARMTPG